jgi:hypothetical protein
MADMQNQIKLMAASMAAFQEKTLSSVQSSMMAMAQGSNTNSNIVNHAPPPIQQADLLGSLPTASQSQTLAPMQAPLYAEYIPQPHSMAPMQATIYTHPNAQIITPTPIIQPRHVSQTQGNPGQQLPAQNSANQSFNGNYRN